MRSAVAPAGAATWPMRAIGGADASEIVLLLLSIWSFLKIRDERLLQDISNLSSLISFEQLGMNNFRGCLQPLDDSRPRPADQIVVDRRDALLFDRGDRLPARPLLHRLDRDSIGRV